jgi:hypothetical protein
MSIQRAPSAAEALLYVHPDSVSSGSPVAAAEGDSIVLLWDNVPQDVLGPGNHYAYSPSYRTVRAFFVRTGPSRVRLSGSMKVPDASGSETAVRYSGEVWVQASDPRAVAAVAAEKPTEQGPAALAQVISRHVSQAIQGELTRLCASGSVAVVIGNPSTIGELAARVQPALQQSGVGISGVQLVNVGSIQLSLEGGQPTAGQQAAHRVSAQRAAVPGQRYPVGDRVFAYWTDGKWYPAIIRGYQDGKYQVDWEGNPHVAWVPEDHVRDDV